MDIITKDEKQTLRLGIDFAKKLTAGDIVLLSGELGAGKSVLARGIAKGLDVNGDILSPTFTIMNTYPLEQDLTLCHIDAFRIKNITEAYEAGLEEFIGANDCINLIEWHKNIAEFVTNKIVKKIKIEVVDENIRKINIL